MSSHARCPLASCHCSAVSGRVCLGSTDFSHSLRCPGNSVLSLILFLSPPFFVCLLVCFVLDSTVDSLCCRTPGLNLDYVCLFFIFKIVFPPEGITCIFLGLSEAGFLFPPPPLGSQAPNTVPSPAFCPQTHPPTPPGSWTSPSPSPTAWLTQIIFPPCLCISSNFLRSLDRKRQIQCLSRCALQPLPIRLKITVDGCPVLSPPPPRPRQPWAPRQVFPTPVHSTRSRPLCRPGCMLGHRCHLAGNLPGSSSPDPPRLDTVAAPRPAHTQESRSHCGNQKWTLCRPGGGLPLPSLSSPCL